MPTVIRHPFTALTYELAGENRVRVKDGNTSDLFDRDGVWIEGDVKSADPCFCRFIASAWIMDQRRRDWGKAYK